MSTLDPSVRVYVDEAGELLTDLEKALLELEADPDDMERVAACFRAMHTIKGGGAMFGFDEISRFTHDVETVYDRVRSKDLAVTPELLSLTLTARDHILSLLENGPGDVPEAAKARSDELLAAFRPFLGAAAPKAPPASESVPAALRVKPGACPSPDTPEGERLAGTYWVRFRPDPDIMRTGTDPLHLLAELAEMGSMRARHDTAALPALDTPDFDPERVYGRWDILLNTACGPDEIRDVFIFVEDGAELRLRSLAPGRVRGSDLADLLNTFDQTPDDPAAIEIALVDRLTQRLGAIANAKAKARAKAELGAGKPRTESGAGTLRVDSERLDILVDMVGELVILQSRLRQAVRAGNLAAAAEVDEDLERLTDAMRDNALGLRMLPIGTVYSVFTRLVRDLSRTLGKEVAFVTHGAETELDKTVIDRLKDPLIHIVRNCLDHGLEKPEVREAAGKPRQGEITLSASHDSGNVLIRIADDGRGIDTAAVRAKAVERGLIAPEAELTDKEIFALLFEPGFSTAKTISDVSGRGVGMDVVKKSIDALRGSVEMESAPGQGTVVVIRLPLTLAIIDGFNVRIGGESFIVPMAHLRGFQERFLAGAVELVSTMERMGELIPVVSLRRLFQVPGEQPDYERVVITEVEGEMVGLTVDVVVGRQQAVIKSLDEVYKGLTWLSGTTINGDGSISLILDIPQLVRFVSSRSEARGGPIQ